jgi:hypothetical protein
MNNPQPDIFIYKMVVDNGGAPCVFRNLLSLAICKPKIRKTAAKGALIFGFGGKRYNERLIYIARVTNNVKGRTYYQRQEYARRPDCIYRILNDRAVRKDSARYHVKSDERSKDVGFHFEDAFVLLSKDFRYLGKRGTNDYKHHHENLGKFIARLKRGHRRYYSHELRKDLLALKAEIWRKYRRMRVGTPSDNDYHRPCNNESAPSGICPPSHSARR